MACACWRLRRDSRLVALISLSLGIVRRHVRLQRAERTVPRPAARAASRGSWWRCKRPRRIRTTSDTASTAICFRPRWLMSRRCPSACRWAGDTERTWGQLVTPSYFSHAGRASALGRFFDADATSSRGGAPAVGGQLPLLAGRTWAPIRASIGNSLRINGHACTVIGVGPQDFLGASPDDFCRGPVAAGYGGRRAWRRNWRTTRWNAAI